MAKFLAEHKRCSVAELLGFVHQSFGVHMDRLTLRRFLKRYGLGSSPPVGCHLPAVAWTLREPRW